MSYDNTNKGAIWGNKDKKSDTHPDFKGSINIEGVEYWLSGWKRDPSGNPNAPAVKFSVTRKDEAHAQGMQQAQQAMQSLPPKHQQPPQNQGYQQQPAPQPQQMPPQAPNQGGGFPEDDIPFS